MTPPWEKPCKAAAMVSARLLLVSGTLLLGAAALLGFMQHRHRENAAASAAWRVVHAGGTGGAVQLLALSAVWEALAGHGYLAGCLAVGVAVSTWAFFVGPLSKALGYETTSTVINRIGAAVAVPSYLGLIAVGVNTLAR
jgi:hypothetical protein